MSYLETTNSSVQATLIAFLNQLTLPGWEIIEGQDSRVPEPAGNYIVVTPLFRERLSTNVTVYADAAFTGSINGNILSVVSVRFGEIDVLSQPALWGVGVVPCNVVAQLPDGTYQVAGPPQMISNLGMAAGELKILQPTKVTYQVDVHSAMVGGSSDLAQTIATVWRDDVAVSFFDQSGVRATPLYCEDPKQTPFINSEQQYETRWTIDVHLQVNAIVDIPFQFMDSAHVTFVPADALPV